MQGNKYSFNEINGKYHKITPTNPLKEGDIEVDGKQLKVEYKSLLGVVGDNKIVAEGIVSGSINIGNLVYCGDGIIILEE